MKHADPQQHRWLRLAIIALAMVASGHASALPDFSGVWQVEKPAPELKTIDGKTPPLKPEAAMVYQERQRKWSAGDLSFDPAAQCISPGLPRMLYLPYPFEIIQSPQKLTYLFAWNYWNRHVYLSDKAQDVPYPLALGLSHGKWDGNSLVIETRSLRADNTLLDAAGMPRSEAMMITERMRLLDSNTLEVRFTFNDSETFVRAWDAVVRFKRLTKGRPITEDICLDRVDTGGPAIDWSGARR